MFDFYVQHEYWFAATQLILAMLGMGATLAPADFGRVATDPRGFSVGILLQLIGVPLLAYFFIFLISDNPGVAVGIAVCASIPGGTISNIFTYFARGHVALSISLTALTAVACLITTPIVLGLLISQYMPDDFVMPSGRIAIEIGMCLLIPLILGMVYLRLLPGSAATFSKWCIRGSLFVIGLIVVGALGSGRIDLQAFGIINISLVFVFVVVLMVASHVIPRLMGNSKTDVIAINLEITTRNTNLGILIKASLFPAVVGVDDPIGDNALFAILLYGGVMLGMGGWLVYRYRKWVGE